MFRILFCLLAVIAGGVALFYGSDSVIGYDWKKNGEDFRYADPPVIQMKSNLKLNQIDIGGIPNEKEYIVCYTYDDFEQITSDSDKINLDFDIQETENFGNSLILSARAENDDYLIIYEPTLLIAIAGYGSDDLISEIEIKDDSNYLRVVNPFEEYSSFISENFRRKNIPYAINSYNLADEKLSAAIKENFFPKYTIAVSRPPRDFPVSLSYEEIQLKMKGIIYDAVINAYHSGYEMVVFKANIKNLKCLQTTLKEMLPLPVKLLPYPYWSETS
jgi:hypothetical protein